MTANPVNSRMISHGELEIIFDLGTCAAFLDSHDTERDARDLAEDMLAFRIMDKPQWDQYDAIHRHVRGIGLRPMSSPYIATVKTLACLMMRPSKRGFWK